MHVVFIFETLKKVELGKSKNRWEEGILKTCCDMECTFGFYKMKGISCLAEKLVVELCCMELINYYSCGDRPKMHL